MGPFTLEAYSLALVRSECLHAESSEFPRQWRCEGSVCGFVCQVHVVPGGVSDSWGAVRGGGGCDEEEEEWRSSVED
jgi:hypothetical protein